MMYSSPGQPPPGTGGSFGAPPLPVGPGGQFGAPQPPSGGFGGQFGAPPPRGGQFGYQSQYPPTQEMAGMTIQPGAVPPPSGGAPQFHFSRPPQQNFGPPPSSSYVPNSTAPPSQVAPMTTARPPQPQGGNFGGQMYRQNFQPPAPNAAPPTSGQTGYGPTPVSGQTGYGPTPVSGQTGYGPTPVSGQTGYGPTPVSGQTGYGPPPDSRQPNFGAPPTSGHTGFGGPQEISGQPPLTSGHTGFGGPQAISGQPPLTSGHTGFGGPQAISGQPPPTSGQGPPLGYGAPPPSQSSGHGLGPPQASGQGPPPTSGMYRPPLPPSSGQVPMLSGQQQPGLGQMMPPPHSMGGQPGPPQPGGFGGGRPPQTQMGMAPPAMGRGSGMVAPPRGPGGSPMMQPPGSPGGPMGGNPVPPPGGPIQQQPRTRIDPDHMPNPVAVMKLDQDQRGSAPFHTSTRGVPPPLVTTDFTVVDDGNCSPRYMRSTMYNVPCTKDLLNNCRIPLGLVVQPLATVPERENTLHTVDHGASGPIRCNRCKTYMNPFVRFVDGGRQYLCPICQCSNEVQPEYFCHLDHKGMRTDAATRPELTFGSVEFTATTDYCKDGRVPKAPAYIFLIDVSAASVSSGLLALISQNILTVCDHLPDASLEEGSPILVGLATYDKVLHFYNVKPTLAQPSMMVVADTADVFVPMVDGFLVNAKEARGVMESLVSQLPEMFSGARPSDVILEPAVRAGLEALKAAQRNGRLFVFHTGLPSAQAPGQLKNRLDPKLLGTDKEKTLLQPASSPYQKLAEECVKHGVGVELFLTPSTYCDVATLGNMAYTTGGQLHLFPNFKTSVDGARLVSELTHCVARHTGFDAVMRVRASTGLRPTGFHGAFFMQNTTDIELGNVDCDKAIAVEIKHDDKLKEEDIVFFQAALLYTTYRGERRLRIHNLALNCSTKFQDLYRSSEIDTIVNFFSKSVTHASLSMPYKTIRDTFTNQCAVILACYRKQCSSQSPAGQLILPESLKLLPMYANCMLKSDALLSPPILTIDEKCWMMYSVLSMTLQQSGAFFYPRMISLHDVDVDEKGLPPVMRCTGQKLQETGVYVIENGFQLVVWVGQQVSHDFISQVFGAPSSAQINPDMPSLPALDNPLSFRVRAICSRLQAARQLQMKLKVVKQRDKSEVFFRRMLKEDKGAGQWEGSSYIDFLCQIHRDIKDILN